MEGTSLTRPKPLLLLAYLALEGPTPRTRLCRLFFDDAANPPDALGTTLRRLRHSGVKVAFDGSAIHCEVECDASSLLRQIDSGAVAEALRAYDAPFLDHLELTLGAELEDWVFATREFIAGRLRHALLQAAEKALTIGDLNAAARNAAAAYDLPGAEEPDSDDLTRIVGIAEATGHHLARQIRNEAGLADTSIATQLAGAGRGTRPPRVVNLPPLTSRLIGRDEELIEIAEILSQPHSRLLTLHGPAGVGKSRLARQAALDQAHSARFEEAVAYVSLATTTESERIPPQIADALGLTTAAAPDPWSDLAERLGAGRHLLILDDFDRHTGCAPQLSALLAECSGLALLVTSRRRLNLAVEWVVTVEGLAVPSDDVDLAEAVLSDALRLFVERAQRADGRFRLSEADLPHAIRVCRAVDGFPLGLELAAAWVGHASLRDLADKLEAGRLLLDQRQSGPSEDETNLRAVIQQSWSLLSRDEQLVAARLSVFRGGFRREAAAAVAGADIPLLLSLVNMSLLRPLPDGRFDWHALLARFMAERLEVLGGSAGDPARKHALYYRDLLLDEWRRAVTEGVDVDVGLLAQESDNVRAAMAWAVERRESEMLLALRQPLAWYFNVCVPASGGAGVHPAG